MAEAAAAKKKAPAKKRAKRKAAPALKAEDFNASDWSFYRAKGLFKVSHLKDGNVLIMSEDGKVKKISEEELAANYESAKGLLKNPPL